MAATECLTCFDGEEEEDDAQQRWWGLDRNNNCGRDPSLDATWTSSICPKGGWAATMVMGDSDMNT